jgi:putative MATE family efflux protein
MLGAMGAEPATAALAVDYLRVLFLALPPMLLLIFVAAVLRGTGDSRTPFVALLGVALGDALLNPLFIFGAGPLPGLGMAGSALATLVANSLGLAGLLAWLRWQRLPLWIGWRQRRHLRPEPALVRCLVTKGLPMGLQMLVVSLSLVLMLALINTHGAQVSAAYGAALQLWAYVQMPAIAVASACTTIAAQNVGAGHWPRVARTARAGVACHLLLTGACVALILACDRCVLALFLPEGSTALEPARHLNRIVLGSFMLLGVSSVLAGVVRSTGAVLAPLAILTLTLWGLRLPLAWGLQPLWGRMRCGGAFRSARWHPCCCPSPTTAGARGAGHGCWTARQRRARPAAHRYKKASRGSLCRLRGASGHLKNHFLPAGSLSGSRQASATCRSLSLAKFRQKSQAMGS